MLSAQPLPPHLRRIREVFHFDFSSAERVSVQLESMAQIIEMILTTKEFISESKLERKSECLICLEQETELISYSHVCSISVVQF